MSSTSSSNGSPNGVGGLGRRNARRNLNPTPSNDTENEDRPRDVEMGAMQRRAISTSGSGGTMCGIPNIRHDRSTGSSNNEIENDLANMNPNDNGRNLVRRCRNNANNNSDDDDTPYYRRPRRCRCPPIRKVFKWLLIVTLGFMVATVITERYIRPLNMHQQGFHRIKLNETPIGGWEFFKLRDIPIYIRPNETTTLIEPTTLCKTSAPLLLLIVVCSAARHFDQRQAIRQTWGNATDFNYFRFLLMHAESKGAYSNIEWDNWEEYAIKRRKTINESKNRIEDLHLHDFLIRTVFLIGRTEYIGAQARIENESRLYDDLIQEDFTDTYNNLTLKTVMMLKYVNTNCVDKVKFVMKSDDDTFVNVPNLVHVLLGGTVPLYEATKGAFKKDADDALSSNNPLRNITDLLFGCLYINAKAVRDKVNKWYVPTYMYLDDIYPNYLSGVGYVMSMDAAEKLYNASLDRRMVHIEDVFVTGIAAAGADVEPRNSPLFKYTSYTQICELRGMIALHHLDPSDLRNAYDFVNNMAVQCLKLDEIEKPDRSSIYHRWG